MKTENIGGIQMSRRHSVFTVNLLFLIILLLQLLNFFLADIPQYVRLILNEAFFILLPSLLYLRWAGLPFKDTMRLRKPGSRTALGSFLIGAGFYPISVILGAIMQVLLKFPAAGAEDILPKTPFEGVLAIIAYAVMAPLCEEVFARGIIQRTYEEYFSPRKAIVFSGVLFIVFHLSFLQGLTIIPLTLALGYVYWRSGSLVASILTHFGANLMASLVVSSTVFWQGAPSVLLSPLGAAVGLLLVVIGFQLVKRSENPSIVEQKEVQPRRLKQAWPLLLAGLLYLGVVLFEFGIFELPGQHDEPIQLGMAQVEMVEVTEYALHNKAGEPFAEGVARLESEGDAIVWHWESVHEAYDVQVGGGRYISSDVTTKKEVSWQKADGTLLYGTALADYGHDQTETRWSLDGDRIHVEFKSSQEPSENFELLLENPHESLVLESNSWPWVLRSLPFASGYSGTACVLRPYTWRQETQDSGPVLEPVTVAVTGPETIATPSGPMPAWKVKVGYEAAWYATEAPHTLLMHDNGLETMVLVAD